MKTLKQNLPLALVLIALAGLAATQRPSPQPGRYQLHITPTAQAPLILDTATGQVYGMTTQSGQQWLKFPALPPE